MHKKMKKQQLIEKLPLILALVGIVIYAAQSTYYALYQIPVMDEGAYLIKGYQFALGNYKPFQPYGFWTNKMVLGFYIWGWIQVIFSPGLLAPRLFAVVFGVATVVGTWLTIKRVGNKWFGMISVWTFALNPYLVGNYSWAVSQILVITMLTWILFLILDRNLPTWRIIAASILSVVLVFTRENMVFFLPLFLLYVFWQHGKKKGFYALGVVLALFIIGHLLFWPGILYLWERWIPDFGSITTESDGPSFGADIGGNSLYQRVLSLTTALRVFLVPLLGSLLVLIFFPIKKAWKSDFHRKSTVFLLVTFAIFLAAHTYASAGLDYCVFCTAQYFAFFGSIGLILFAASYESLKKSDSPLRKILSAVLLIIIFSLVGFSLFELIGNPLNNISFPRIADGKILPGSARLWQILANKFGLSFETSRRLLPTLLGLLIGIVGMLLILIFSKRLALRHNKTFFNYFIILLFIPILLFLPLINQLPKGSLCSASVPRIYQSMANRILSRIDPGEKVFTFSNISNVPLIYLPIEHIYPPQVNGDFGLRTSDNTDELLEAGYWSLEAKERWINEAEFFIVGVGELGPWEDEEIESRRIFSMGSSLFSGACPADENIYIFMRED